MNRFLASIFCAAMVTAGGSAMAQKAALVQAQDDAARSPYQEGVNTSCQFAGNCAQLFSPVPAGRRRVIEQVSCFIQLSGGSMEALTLYSNTLRLPRVALPLVQSPGLSTAFTANTPVLLFYDAGEVARIDGFSSGVINSMFCTLSGREVTVP